MNASLLRVGVKWGAIVGVIVYVALLALALLLNALTGTGSPSIAERPVLLIPICLGYFALLFACSAAGFYTGRETGNAALGALAGVVTAIVQYVLGLVYTPSSGHTTTSTTALSGAGQVLVTLISALLVAGIAASMGWLGGRPGAQQFARRHKADAPDPETGMSRGE
jgi:hypothetical protein